MSNAIPHTHSYVKDNGEASLRSLHIIAEAPAQNLQALDLTGLSEADAGRIRNLYDTWVVEVKKPFDKLQRAFRAENFVDFDKYLANHGIVDRPTLKSFKVHGLNPVEAAA